MRSLDVALGYTDAVILFTDAGARAIFATQ